MPYHRLDVYRKAYQLALEVHRMSLEFPKLEQYGLAQQLRASSKSVPVNIAEGMGKQESAAEVRRFVRIAIGSCDETRCGWSSRVIWAMSISSSKRGWSSATRRLAGCCRGSSNVTMASSKVLSSFQFLASSL